MSRAVLDSTTTEPEPNHPETTLRSVVWAAGIGSAGVLALIVILAMNLLFGDAPAARPSPADTTPATAVDTTSATAKATTPATAVDTTSATAKATTPATAPDSRHLTLAAPDTIAGLRRTASRDFPGLAAKATAKGLTKPVAVTYGDPTDAFRLATVWGGSGRPGGAQHVIDDYRDTTAALVPGASLGASTPVDPGPVGGLAQCAPLGDVDFTATVCAWTAADAVLAVIATGYDLDAATDLLPDLLSVMVRQP